MTGRTVIGGKVMRAPDLERLDRMRPKADVEPSLVAADHDPRSFKSGLFEKDAGRTWARDKALLIALGVDGDVPLAQARVNAGLDSWPGERGRETQVRAWQEGLRPAGLRGSGTTGKLLLSLDEGDAFVVGNGTMAKYTLDLLRYLRGPEFARCVKIVIASTAHEQLMGRRGRVILDHDLIYAVPLNTYERVLEVSGAINARWRPANDNEIAAKAA